MHLPISGNALPVKDLYLWGLVFVITRSSQHAWSANYVTVTFTARAINSTSVKAACAGYRVSRLSCTCEGLVG